MKTILKNDNSQTSKRKSRRSTLNLVIVMTFILQLILPVGLHVNAMSEAEVPVEAVTAQMHEAEDPEKAEKDQQVEEAEKQALAEKEAEAEAVREAEAEAEAAQKAEAEAAQKAEAEAARKAEEEAARKAEEEAARKAEEEAARKAEEEEAAQKAEAARKAEADKKDQETKKTEKTEDKSSPSKFEEVDDDTEEEVEEEVNLENEEEEEESNLAEDVRATRHLTFPVPMMRKRALMSNGGSDGFVEVKKTAVRLKDSLDELLNNCRTFLVNLEITGEPPSVPVDVVLILDKSGSMNEKTPITSAPVVDNITKYFVRVGTSYSDYREVTHVSGNTWKYGSGSGTRYVYWDANGNDTGAGSSNTWNAVGKPFYYVETRMDAAKSASINFAGKVLNEAPAGSRVSVVEFSGPEYTNGYGSQNQAQTSVGLTNNITTITNAINLINAVGGTNTQAGYLQARGVIENSGNPNSNKVVVMFTDGVPTASNGYIYANPTSISHGHVTRAVNAGKGIFTDGVADVFTVGLLQGMSGSDRTIALHLLEETQNKGWYEAPTATDLDQIFAEIAEEINYFGEDAVVVDKIGDNFDLIESTLPQGASYNPNTREITWDIGRMSSKKTLSYVVQAKPGFAGGLADTNEYATLTYTDPFGTTGLTKTFNKPEVNVPTLIEVSLTDASIDLGQSINLGIGEDAAGENYMSPVTGGDNDEINFTYEWRKVGDNTVIPGGKNPSVSPVEDTEYELTVTDSNGCIAVATMTVRVNKNIGKISISKMIKDLDYIDELTFFGGVNPPIFVDIEFEIKVSGPDNYENIIKLQHGDNETIDELALGEYSIEEINIDGRFLLDNINPTSFELTKENKWVEVEVVNKVNYANFEFTKVDEEGNSLAGIEFELSKDGVTETVTTVANEKVSFNFLEEGEYVLRETKTIAGFRLPTETWIIEVVRNVTTGQLEVIIPDDSFIIGNLEEGYEIENKEQNVFPQTGGVGGLSYIIAGVTILTTSLGIYIKKEEKEE